jgi:uncharacterized protein (TIGR02452 family)
MATRNARVKLVVENDSFTADLLVHYPALRHGPSRSVRYDCKTTLDQARLPRPILDSSTITAIYPTDTISCARHLTQEGFRPLVLNFASHKRAGGGYAHGSLAQEECLFYVSSYNLLANPRLYPLSEEQAVYTPDVVVYRNPKTLEVLDWGQCWTASFLALPALNLGRTSRPHTPAERALMVNKIRLMCEVALENGHDSLVLGAWGSGVFGNEPEEVARLFQVVLYGPVYKDRFKRLAFAIPAQPRNGNLEAYQSVFARSD